MPASDRSPAPDAGAVGARTRLAVALELADFGARVREHRFRREHPAASDDEVASFMRTWWAERPGAPDGDAIGRPRPDAIGS